MRNLKLIFAEYNICHTLIKGHQITEVDSKNHIIMQYFDVV